MTKTKALNKSYVYWLTMDWYIGSLVESCRSCALAAKARLIKYQLWPETNSPWSRVHINYAEQGNGIYYLIIVDTKNSTKHFYARDKVHFKVYKNCKES